MFVKLAGRMVVVVGGGATAEQKIPGLLSSGARVVVVAPQVTPRIAEWNERKALEWSAKHFEAGDLAEAFLVIAATSASGVNEAVYRGAEERGILCNAVDDIRHCHFYYGSVVQRGDLQIAISTNGKSPALAQRLRQELEAQFGPEYEQWLEALGQARELLRGTSDADTEATKLLSHKLVSAPMFERFVRERQRELAGQGTA
jgi:siroheme synthase-like protein